jgi:maltose O-acetyltransferase
MRGRLVRARRRLLARVRGEDDLDALVAEGLQLGARVYVASQARLDRGRPWLITIEDDAVISPFVIVLAHDASLIGHTGFARLQRVVIGKRVVVGAGAIILPGTRIGEDSVVGAGAVVRGEIPPRSLVVGNPGKVVGDVSQLAAFHRVEAANRPKWPYQGWSKHSGITARRMREQRDALADGGPGFVAARPDFAWGPNGSVYGQDMPGAGDVPQSDSSVTPPVPEEPSTPGVRDESTPAAPEPEES